MIELNRKIIEEVKNTGKIGEGASKIVYSFNNGNVLKRTTPRQWGYHEFLAVVGMTDYELAKMEEPFIVTKEVLEKLLFEKKCTSQTFLEYYVCRYQKDEFMPSVSSELVILDECFYFVQEKGRNDIMTISEDRWKRSGYYENIAKRLKTKDLWADSIIVASMLLIHGLATTRNAKRKGRKLLEKMSKAGHNDFQYANMAINSKNELIMIDLGCFREEMLKRGN